MKLFLFLLLVILILVEKKWEPRFDQTKDGKILLHFNHRKGRNYIIIYQKNK